MPPLRVEQLDSVEKIREIAGAWDRLWQQSHVTMPTVRAELVAQWLEHFTPWGPIRVATVWEGERLVAALPLAGRQAKRLLRVGDLTSNYWSPNGELLLDPNCDTPAVLDALARAIRPSPWPLLWLELVPFERPDWQAFLAALARHGMQCHVQPRYAIGKVEVRGDYEDYEVGISKNLRRSMRKDLRRLESGGRVTLRLLDHTMPEEADRWLREVLALEEASWKGRDGQTVLRTPGMPEFYRRQARQLAAWGCLRMAFLEQGQRRIAFELGWVGKRVYHSFKVGFDEAYREFGPGHLMRRFLLQRLFARGDVAEVDFQGPLTDALAEWSTETYSIGRIVGAPRGVKGRTVLAAYRAAGALRGVFRGASF